LNQDLHGGWWDAGDFNKYTSWGASDAIELLHAYAESPSAFSDDTNIPESGNGVPDVLDEVKWELDWLTRMQSADGSVLSVVNEPAAKSPTFGGSPDTVPSGVTEPCAYGPDDRRVAVDGGRVHHAAVVLRSVGAAGTAFPGTRTILRRAQQAWTWRARTPPCSSTTAGESLVGAGEQECPADEPSAATPC
jgi:hypothetical protein